MSICELTYKVYVLIKLMFVLSNNISYWHFLYRFARLVITRATLLGNLVKWMKREILFCETAAAVDFVRFVGLCIKRRFAWIEFILTKREGYGGAEICVE